MAEEHRFQSPQGQRLCANNCGFFGSPATLNLCSKCYRDSRLNDQQQPSSSSATAAGRVKSAVVSSPLWEVVCDGHDSATAAGGKITPAESSGQETRLGQPNRCAACRRRVGLTGFNCRCGTTFCGTHRYPEQHGCSFDFKGEGRQAIAMANPVIKAAKIEKI
ncbi:hypothetical protein L1049_012336 [Liquidambar formosana]|uniref:Zinc finger A20 and AN1 domain-containing stress-associated protein 4 n=1 Tax=Liquidambar formosana TaxID=63359 RepID=A0AAP0RSZ5_LIQFO